MAEILYKYCKDENDELICIDDINKENPHDHKYKCLCCGRDMIAKLSGKGVRSKRSHFAHDKGYSCNSETYLHKLAKIRIREKFYAERGLVVHLHDVSECGEKGWCKMYNEHLCYKEVNETYNLCDYYDTCEEERGIDGVVADLLLTKSDKPNRDPVLIEIYVKHKCAEEKIKTGLKIFETKQIQSEDDINEILENHFLAHPQRLSFDNNVGIAYNIKPKVKCSAKFSRFILFPKGETKVLLMPCENRMQAQSPNSLVELNINKWNLLHKVYENEYELPNEKILGLLYIAHREPKFHNCLLCKNMSRKFCTMFSWGTPQHPKDTYAMLCDKFCFGELFNNISVEDLYECIELVKEEGLGI